MSNPSFRELAAYIKKTCPNALVFESQRDGHIIIDTKLKFPEADDHEALGLTLVPLEDVK